MRVQHEIVRTWPYANLISPFVYIEIYIYIFLADNMRTKVTCRDANNMKIRNMHVLNLRIIRNMGNMHNMGVWDTVVW